MVTYFFSFFSACAAKVGGFIPNWYESQSRGCECQAFDSRMSGLPCKPSSKNELLWVWPILKATPILTKVGVALHRKTTSSLIFLFYVCLAYFCVIFVNISSFYISKRSIYLQLETKDVKMSFYLKYVLDYFVISVMSFLSPWLV